MTHFSLFSGIGGIDLAAEWAGFRTVGQCEIDAYATKVLEKNFPNVERWRDIRDVTVESFRGRTGITELTLLSGGFPCQPHSVAGKRKASADERDLWAEFARVIREIRPKWVLGENVPGLLSSEDGRFFGRVLRDLDEMGYNVGWCCYGASEVGALHRRERVFIVAYPDDRYVNADKKIQTGRNSIEYGSNGTSPYADGERELQQKRRKQKFRGRACDGGETTIANPNEIGLQRGLFTEEQSKANEQFERICLHLRRYADKECLSKSFVCGGNNGIPRRVDRLKCLGNAVVPQQVYPILEAIAEIERNTGE